ncbi:MAG: hypothetical protein AAF721_34120 [Myxococcota bacterium]
MPEPRPSRGGHPAPLLASFALLAACTGVDEGRTDAEVEQLRLGRVHVVLDAGGTEADPDDFEVSARFAYVRGLDEDFVRARIEMPVLAHDVLQAPDCIASDQLVGSEGEADGGDVQELVLVDAGDLRVDIGETRYDVPLSLVPDLLPYMSGVEYVMYSDELPAIPVDGVSMAVTASGSQTDELPPFATEGHMPGALELSGPAEAGVVLRDDALALSWRASDLADDTLTLRITAMTGDEPTGSEITCLVPDVGEARLVLSSLRALGLASGGDAVRVEASRIASSTFDAGDFAGSELVVERRETTIVR